MASVSFWMVRSPRRGDPFIPVDPGRNCPGSLVSATSSASSSSSYSKSCRSPFYDCKGTDSLPPHTHTDTSGLRRGIQRGEEWEYLWHTSSSVQALILPPKAPLFTWTLDIEGFRLAVSRERTNANLTETAPSWGIIIVGQAVLLTAVNGDAVCNWGGLICFCPYMGSR